MNKMQTKSLQASVFITMSFNALAAKIERPSFIEEAGADAIDKAGAEVNTYILIFMAVVIACFSVRPGYLFITGKTAEGLDHAKDVLIGGVLAVLLGGIAFAVMDKV